MPAAVDSGLKIAAKHSDVIDVIKEGNVITSAYPEENKPTPGFAPTH